MCEKRFVLVAVLVLITACAPPAGEPPGRPYASAADLFDAYYAFKLRIKPLAMIPSPMFDLPSFELMPVNQIFSLNLYITQLAAGTSTQPFASVADYDNWLKRLDDYVAWLDTAIRNMTRGVERHGAGIRQPAPGAAGREDREVDRRAIAVAILAGGDSRY